MRTITHTMTGRAGRAALVARVRRAPVWLQVDPASVPDTGGRAP